MTFKSISALIILIVLQGPFITEAHAAECKTAGQKNCTVTLRDNRGIKVGTEDRGSSGTTTIRDKRGIKQGTITNKPGKASCEVIRDARGIKVGTRGNC